MMTPAARSVAEASGQRFVARLRAEHRENGDGILKRSSGFRSRRSRHGGAAAYERGPGRRGSHPRSACRRAS
eukprot:1715050-Prymnesium_polylepis.1